MLHPPPPPTCRAGAAAGAAHPVAGRPARRLTPGGLYPSAGPRPAARGAGALPGRPLPPRHPPARAAWGPAAGAAVHTAAAAATASSNGRPRCARRGAQRRGLRMRGASCLPGLPHVPVCCGRRQPGTRQQRAHAGQGELVWEGNVYVCVCTRVGMGRVGGQSGSRSRRGAGGSRVGTAGVMVSLPVFWFGSARQRLLHVPGAQITAAYALLGVCCKVTGAVPMRCACCAGGVRDGPHAAQLSGVGACCAR